MSLESILTVLFLLGCFTIGCLVGIDIGATNVCREVVHKDSRAWHTKNGWRCVVTSTVTTEVSK